ncbi:uncharacterized protein LOC128991527 isoform X2 [Macrosteles quadrilineatus]|nr:uncharacterized protein LOC128991527 isoform X2 [Macrosteles quadrilineatus]XP_054270463.1 uncharacterized protein LOC128991527 isoform X2 [Macrosteles quadrilineatus]XP_054270464.1 uncharacterized protein LOC128991527 isoform X2 [Macrosteles quadrilineatus]
MSLEGSNNTDKDESKVDFVHVLPMEVIEEIFLYLSPRDLAACTSVSTAWRDAVNSNKVWGRLCDKNNWKDEFEPHFSHFSLAQNKFRRWVHSLDSFTPMCHKRMLYNKHSCLQRHWRHGKYRVEKISNGPVTYLQLFEPVTCDGRYLVVQDKGSKFSTAVTLQVWSLNGEPSKVCDLDLPRKVDAVESVAFDFGTIVVAQAWIIIVYRLKDKTFEKVFEKTDLADLEPKSRLPKDIKRMAPHLKVTQDYIICVPNFSHSTVDFIPIFFWDRITGELKHTLPFDSMYYQIANAVWFQDSCYLSLSNKKKKSYQVVQFGLKSAAWEAFSHSVDFEVEEVVVGDSYVLAVTKTSNAAFREVFSRHETPSKELWLWDRQTGDVFKTLEAQGRGFQFVNDYLMYYDSSKVTVLNPKAPDMCSEFEVSGTISSIQAAKHPSIIAIIKTSCYIEVWDWGLGTRLYTITAETGYGSQLWCDDS